MQCHSMHAHPGWEGYHTSYVCDPQETACRIVALKDKHDKLATEITEREC